MITEQQHKQLETELASYKRFLSDTSDAIVDQDISAYPIFVVHQQEINIGIPLDTDHIAGQWLINASSLEEFVTKQVIQAEKVDAFKSIYKNPKAFLGLFVVEDGSAKFVFIPRN